MNPVEHVTVAVKDEDQVPAYGELVAWGSKTLVVNEDPYDKDYGYCSMAFVIDEAGTLVLEDGKAKTVFLEFQVPQKPKE